MKNTILLASLGFTLSLTSLAHATGTETTLYNCSGGAGEAKSSLHVTEIRTVIGGDAVKFTYKASATSGWFGGMRKSGDVNVEAVSLAADGGPVSYINKEAGFTLTINRKTVSRAGKTLRVVATAKFKDPTTGMAGEFNQRELSCR